MSEERVDPDSGWLRRAVLIIRLVTRAATLVAFFLFWYYVLGGDTHWALAWLGIFITLRLDEIERKLRDE